MRFATTPLPISILPPTGFSYDIWPQAGVAVSFGARIEGIPAYDLIGGDMGFRRPGYTVSLETGHFVDRKKCLRQHNGPRGRLSQPDKKCAGGRGSAAQTGDAAFADYFIQANRRLQLLEFPVGETAARARRQTMGAAPGDAAHSFLREALRRLPVRRRRFSSPIFTGRSSACPPGTVPAPRALRARSRPRDGPRVAWENRCERRIRHRRRGVVRTGSRGSRLFSNRGDFPSASLICAGGSFAFNASRRFAASWCPDSAANSNDGRPSTTFPSFSSPSASRKSPTGCPAFAATRDDLRQPPFLEARRD